ncbi:MAG TPA: nucleotidyltransferase family protein [Bacteroidota bacterium]|nr:nucleotidyltransferase family protein [Bacteroidota bacterium]
MNSPPHIAILILAAGNSSRFGTPKQLLAFNGRSLLRFVTETALSSKADSVTVVVGYEAERMQAELQGLSVTIITNRNWEKGMGSSLFAGIHMIARFADAALIMLADQPLISADTLNAIIDPYRTGGRKIVASEYSGTIGVPALFDKQFFPELTNVTGDSGAKLVLQKHRDLVTCIPFPLGAVDVDTPADYEKLTRSSS